MGKSIPIKLIDDGSSLYVAEGKVYPRDIRGRYDSLRRLAVVVLLGLYYLLPWLNIDGVQSVLFDLPARRFHVLGLVFWPQDFVFLALLLIIAGIALFFFTAVAGRLWCGYACPQTVWTELFLWIERWTEGDRSRRIKLDAGLWTREKWLRKGSKHALWLLLALWTGFTFVGFFTPIRDLGSRLLPFEFSGWETFWVLFYALATWGNAGVLREQVCKYMCPYARFQSAMFDRNTLLIAYDPRRGEPRGARRRGLGSVLERARGLLSLGAARSRLARALATPSLAERQAPVQRSTGEFDGQALAFAGPVGVPVADDLGDCIDCTLCVQVCPVGIDIRAGLQYECIACGACIDACDQVMDKLAYPRGLIRYTTQNAADGLPTRILRPRVLVYGTLLLILLVGWGWGVANRSPVLADLLRDRNALYRIAAAGDIENGYSLKLVNKLGEPQQLRIGVAPGSVVGLATDSGLTTLDADSVTTLALTLRAPAGALRGRVPVQLLVERVDPPGAALTLDTAFFGPP